MKYSCFNRQNILHKMLFCFAVYINIEKFSFLNVWFTCLVVCLSMIACMICFGPLWAMHVCGVRSQTADRMDCTDVGRCGRPHWLCRCTFGRWSPNERQEQCMQYDAPVIHGFRWLCVFVCHVRVVGTLFEHFHVFASLSRSYHLFWTLSCLSGWFTDDSPAFNCSLKLHCRRLLCSYMLTSYHSMGTRRWFGPLSMATLTVCESFSRPGRTRMLRKR